MTDALLIVGVASLVTVGTANLLVAGHALRTARRYVELAEARMERLREDQARISVLLSDDRRNSEEEREHDDRRDAGRRIDRLKRELLAPAARGEREVGAVGTVVSTKKRALDEVRPVGGAPLAEAREARQKPPRPAGFPETARRSSSTPGEAGTRRGVWHPHPDDDVSPGVHSGGRNRDADGTPVEIFRRHYDKYLDNYEGYVKLADRIRQISNQSGVSPGSPAEQEWTERLRRVDDGIKRTTARLDILEEYNPELATDDRISRRASIARAHSEL
jgi:hypothetical protein